MTHWQCRPWRLLLTSHCSAAIVYPKHRNIGTLSNHPVARPEANNRQQYVISRKLGHAVAGQSTVTLRIWNCSKYNQWVIRAYIMAEVDFTAAVDTRWLVPQVVPHQQVLCNHTIHSITNQDPTSTMKLLTE